MEQMNMFELTFGRFSISKKIRLIELFGGIGSQAKALENLESMGKLPMGFEHYRYVEFDKYPVASYNAIHDTNFEPTDITKIHASDLGIVERDKYEYLLTYSFPCQDLSLAGKGKGMTKGSGTRSGLLWEVERLLKECETELPQVLLMENVPQVIGEKNIDDFNDWIRFLESKGYSNYVKVLNAKEIGYPNPIPQNRQRCFMVSILGDAYYEFPKPIPLRLKLKDMLEDEVDEKYFLSQKMIEYITADNDKWKISDDKYQINRSVARTINTGEGRRRCDASNYICDELPEDINIKEINNKKVRETLEQNDLNEVKDVAYMDGYNRKIKTDGTSNAITTGIDFRNNDFILIKNATKQGFLEASEGDGIDISTRMETHRGTVQKDMVQTIKAQCDVGVVVAAAQRKRDNGQELEISNREVANSITTAQKDSMVAMEGKIKRIGNYSPSGHSATSIVDTEGIAPTVMENHGQVTAIKVDAPKVIGGIGEKKSNHGTQWYQQDRIYDDNIAISVTTGFHPFYKSNLRIRKLTPKECWRLMGFSDQDFNKASKVNSNAQLYKQAGNSIVVNCLMAIFLNLL